MTSPKGMSDVQKALARVALKWVVSKATKSKPRKWRVRKTSRGWTVWAPGKLIPTVYRTYAEAIAAIGEHK